MKTFLNWVNPIKMYFASRETNYNRSSMARTHLEPGKYVRNGQFELMSVNHSARTRDIIGISFRVSVA